MLFFHLYKFIFFYVLCFPIYNNVYLNITKAIETMSVNEIKDFIFENYYKGIGFSKNISHNSMKRLNKKDLRLIANKLMKNVPDPPNAKEHYKSFIIKENRKSVKQSEIITYQPITFQNLGIVDIKSFITEYPKTSHELSNIIGKGEKVGFNSTLYSNAKKLKNF